MLPIALRCSRCGTRSSRGSRALFLSRQSTSGRQQWAMGLPTASFTKAGGGDVCARSVRQVQAGKYSIPVPARAQ